MFIYYKWKITNWEMQKVTFLIKKTMFLFFTTGSEISFKIVEKD